MAVEQDLAGALAHTAGIYQRSQSLPRAAVAVGPQGLDLLQALGIGIDVGARGEGVGAQVGRYLGAVGALIEDQEMI